MTRFEVWKRKRDKEQNKRNCSYMSLREIGDHIRSTYPDRVNEPQALEPFYTAWVREHLPHLFEESEVAKGKVR